MKENAKLPTYNVARWAAYLMFSPDPAYERIFIYILLYFL